MPYNPYYQSYSPYQQAMPQYQQQQSSSGLIWVQGIEAMKSYPVTPGQSVLLMDSESNCFGIKTVDTSGMPLPLRIFDYQERTAQNPQPVVQPTAQIDTSEFVTREEFETRIAEIMPKRKKPEGAEKNAE